MSSVNKVILLGKLGQDPELKHTPSGKAVCNFSMATSKSWDKDGKKEEKTEWHRVVVWGKIAETSNQYLQKGSTVYVEGELQTRSWDDKDGKKRYTTEVNAKSVQFIGGRPEKNDALKTATNNTKDYDVKTDESFAEDSIPF